MSEENDLKKIIIKKLDILEALGLLLFERINSGSISNRVRGARKGTADIIIAVPPSAKLIALELKSQTGKQSCAQSSYQEKVERIGGEYFLIRTPSEFDQMLKKIIPKYGANYDK